LAARNVGIVHNNLVKMAGWARRNRRSRASKIFGRGGGGSQNPGVEASAVWLPPGDASRTAERRERAGLTAVVSTFSDAARARYDAVVEDHRRVSEAAQSVPHWFLAVIGVDPARQGLGLGTLLLRAGLARVDQDGVECHLFTEQPRNVQLYQRYGFEIAAEGDVPDGGPHFWFMRRRPHAIAR
jgi:GNAT superfamily N-acetyltransferase